MAKTDIAVCVYFGFLIVAPVLWALAEAVIARSERKRNKRRQERYEWLDKLVVRK